MVGWGGGEEVGKHRLKVNCSFKSKWVEKITMKMNMDIHSFILCSCIPVENIKLN